MKRFVFYFFAGFLFPFSLLAQNAPLVITDNGYIFIDVVLNGSVKAKFLFDTGGGLMVVSEKVYNELTAAVKPAGTFSGFRHDGERVDFDLFSVPSVSFGSLKLNNIKAGVYPKLDEYGIDGIISLKEIECSPVTIDFKNKTMSFENYESMAEIEKSAAVIPAKLHRQTDVSLDMFISLFLNDSIKIDAEFDTGSGFNGLFINTYYLDKLGLDSVSAVKKSYKVSPDGKNYNDYVLNLNKISISGADRFCFNNINAVFRQGLIYQGLIGSGIFKENVLTIDVPNSRILIK